MVLVRAGWNMFSSLYQYLLLYLRCVIKMWRATRLSFGPVAVLEVCIGDIPNVFHSVHIWLFDGDTYVFAVENM